MARVQPMLKSQVQRIEQHQVLLAVDGGPPQSLPNDHVIVCAGGELPTPLLKSIGIRFETKFGKA